MNKPPPQDIEVEKTVLMSLLTGNSELVDECSLELKPECFYVPKNKYIYEKIIEIYNNQNYVDTVLITSKYPEVNDAIIDMMDVSTSNNLEPYIKILKEKYRLRFIIELASNTVNSAYSGKDFEEIVSKFDSELLKLESNKKNKIINLKEYLPTFYDELSKDSSEQTIIYTGLKDIDNNMNGAHPGELIIIGGSPGTGKTALAGEIAKHNGINEMIPTLIVSIEMTVKQLMERTVANIGEVNKTGFRTKRFRPDELERLGIASNKINQFSKLYVWDDGDLDIFQIQAGIKRAVRKYGIKLVIIDYLQIIKNTSNYKEKRDKEGEKTDVLRKTAKELQIPIIALSQLSREHVKKGRRPTMEDLKETSNLEQDAHIILLLYSAYKAGEKGKNADDIEVIFAKFREGKVGTKDLKFLGEYARFYDIDVHHKEEGPVF